MIQFQTIDGLLLRDMVLAGAALLEKNREEVDALNVFPVPDGDTGTNMTLTMQSATRELNSKEFLRADEAAAAVAKGALRGARGNSGVITSQLFRGFSKALAGVEKITPTQFAAALKKGADQAYKAVMKPKEGTILTVARVIAEDAMKQAETAPDDFDALMTTMLRSGEAILKRTTEMLPALKQANVVDSGGRGLLYIYTGYAAVMRGQDINELTLGSGNDEEKPVDLSELSVSDVKHAYWMDFSVQRMEDVNAQDIDSFRRRLNRIGDTVKVTGSPEEGVQVSVHTDNPGLALEFGLELGELNDVHVENVLAKVRAEEEARKAAETPVEPPKDFGMVAVSLGDGFSQIFKDLTVDVIVEGGQTMNPSIDDIYSAIAKVNAKTVFVFPNNGNVVMAAQQAAKLAKEQQVFVIPTKNVAMGIAAAIAFRGDVSGEENAAAMEEAAQHVKTGTVTYAVRDSEYNGVEIHQGDIIGLHNGAIEYSGPSVHDVVMEMMKAIITEDDELITVYYGQETTEEDAQAIADEIGEVYPDCDVECMRGGQPLYYYLIAVE